MFSDDLEVKRTGASIIAREVWGALRGLETFSQLIYRDEHGKVRGKRHNKTKENNILSHSLVFCHTLILL